MEKMGLYVHHPFCVKKCRYCDFASRPETGAAEIEAYYRGMLKEISQADPAPEKQIDTLYFGGGTPSYVGSRYLKQVVTALADHYQFDPLDDKREMTIEVNPASAMAEKLYAYRAIGFNRLSIGLQATQERLLHFLGRAHTVGDFKETVRHAVAAGFENISADLIFGVPGQTVDDVKASLDYLLSLPRIRHLSCYSLIVEPGTVFDTWRKQGKLALPPEETEREMYQVIGEETARKGMKQYEISNYAYPGFESRHNSGYWTMMPYRGFGLAAASFNGFRRWTNTAVMADYLKAPGQALAEGHRLTEQERQGDFMFLGLRRLDGVADADYHRLFGSSFWKDYQKEIDHLLNEGLVFRKDDRLALTKRGLDLANQVFMAFV